MNIGCEKRWFVFVLSFLIFAVPVGAVVKVSGSLTEDAIWTKAAGPYLVQGDLMVEKGVTLTIEPGTVIYVLNTAGGKKSPHSTTNTDIIIRGTLEARGTAAQPIYFTPAKKGTSWGGICFWGGKDQSSMEFCWVAYGGIYCDNASPYLISCGLTKCQFALMIYGSSKPNVSKTRFVGNRSGIYMSHKNAALSLTNSELRGNGYGIVLREFKSLEASSNRIHNNQMSAVNMTQRDVDLSGNWWGTKDEYEIAKVIHDAKDDPKLGRLHYLPFFGQSEAEAAAAVALRESDVEKKLDLKITDWEYSVPTAGRALFADAATGKKQQGWKLLAVIVSGGATAALLLLL